jgi:hypothetical protein
MGAVSVRERTEYRFGDLGAELEHLPPEYFEFVLEQYCSVRAGTPGWWGRRVLGADGVGRRDPEAVRHVARGERVIATVAVMAAAVPFFLDVHQLAISRQLAVLSSEAPAVEGRESEQSNEITHRRKLRG